MNVEITIAAARKAQKEADRNAQEEAEKKAQEEIKQRELKKIISDQALLIQQFDHGGYPITMDRSYIRKYLQKKGISPAKELRRLEAENKQLKIKKDNIGGVIYLKFIFTAEEPQSAEKYFLLGNFNKWLRDSSPDDPEWVKYKMHQDPNNRRVFTLVLPEDELTAQGSVVFKIGNEKSASEGNGFWLPLHDDYCLDYDSKTHSPRRIYKKANAG